MALARVCLVLLLVLCLDSVTGKPFFDLLCDWMCDDYDDDISTTTAADDYDFCDCRPVRRRTTTTMRTPVTPMMPGWNPNGTPGWNPNGMPGWNPNGMPVWNPNGMPGWNPNGMPGGNTNGMPGGNPNGVPVWNPNGMNFMIMPDGSTSMVRLSNNGANRWEMQFVPRPAANGVATTTTSTVTTVASRNTAAGAAPAAPGAAPAAPGATTAAPGATTAAAGATTAATTAAAGK